MKSSSCIVIYHHCAQCINTVLEEVSMTKFDHQCANCKCSLKRTDTVMHRVESHYNCHQISCNHDVMKYCGIQIRHLSPDRVSINRLKQIFKSAVR